MNNIASLLPFIYVKLGYFILVFTRISAFFTVFMLFRRDFVNVRIVISLATLLSVYMVLLTPIPHTVYEVFSFAMLVQTGLQFLIGFIAGFILNIAFELFVTFGQIVSTQVGLSLASMFDPMLGSITTLTHFYTFAIILVFLLLDGHLIAIQTLMTSFDVLPAGEAFVPKKFFMNVLQYSNVMFTGGMVLSITIVVSVMLINFALALMTRFAPQFNLFSIGINMILILGLASAYFMFDVFTAKGAGYLQDALHVLQNTIGKPS